MDRRHVTRVIESLSSDRAAAHSPVAASWVRCHARHGIDPAERRRIEVDGARVAAAREALGRLLSVAGRRLDDLHRMIGHSGRAIFLTDAEGLVLESRTRDGDAGAYDGAGLAVGTDWSEARQGTNGIGTCLAESRAVIIHRDQHYLAQNIGMSCLDAPIFGTEGEVIAALDVSSLRPDDGEGFTQLIGAMLGQVAAQIETDLFRSRFDGARILLMGEDAPSADLVAVDRDEIVVGATRAARRRLGLSRTGAIRPVPLRDLTGESAQGLEGAERAAVKRALARAGGNVSAAARNLGIGRATLYRRMARLGIADS